MIRFVDMRAADIAGIRFAFWDTSTDRFVEIDGEQAWGDWDEMELSGCRSWRKDQPTRERLRGLCPEWVFIIEAEDDKELPCGTRV